MRIFPDMEATTKPALPQGDPRRYTAETVRRTRPATYQRVVNLLADPEWSIRAISDNCKTSEHTVRAIQMREAEGIETRKKELSNLMANIALNGGERMFARIGKAPLRDATIGTGVAIDKLVALTSQTPAVQVAIVNMPSREERERQRAIDDKLDAIFRQLNPD